METAGNTVSEIDPRPARSVDRRASLAGEEDAHMDL